MKTPSGQIPPYRLQARNEVAGLTFAPGIDGLSAAIIVEANHEANGQFLEPAAVPASGATVRIVAYAGMAEGQDIELIWQGRVSYVGRAKVTEGGRYLDFSVPKQIILDNVVAGRVEYCQVNYYVVRGNGDVDVAPVTRIGIVDSIAANPPPMIPQATNGEFKPDAIPEPGLKIQYLRPVDWGAFWISYGRDGRVIATVRFGLYPEETFVYMWRNMLDQTEPGGEVRTNYYASNDDGVFCQSLHAVLRVLG